MLSRKTFNHLSNSLKWGFFSDEMVMILSRLKKTRKLDEKDKKSLSKAKDFLEDAIKGHDWIEKNTYNNQKSAFAFSQAVKVLSHIETSEQFIKYIKRLLNIAENILNSKKVAKEDIEVLIGFFTDYGKNQLEVSEELINGGLGYSRWQLTKAL